MTVEFAETSIYRTVLNPRDQWHKRAASLSRAVTAKTVTSEYVLCEFGAVMARGDHRALFVELVGTLREDKDALVIEASSDLFQRGLELFATRSDKSWSITDCISFAIMKEWNISDALASDHHFEQAGFRPLLAKF